MRRVFSAALCFAALFVFAGSRAPAATEFCPATLVIQAVNHAEDDTSPAALYGFELTALGPRRVDAKIAFDTGDGWYTLSLSGVDLHEKDRHYTGDSSRWIYPDWVSGRRYVVFPHPVKFVKAWIIQAQAFGDGDFGWEKRGQVQCTAPPGDPNKHNRTGRKAVILDPKDSDALNASPPAGSPITVAVSSPALEMTACKEVFRDASAASVAPFNFSNMQQKELWSAEGIYGQAAIKVAIAADGKLLDAWVYEPSGSKDFDNALLSAARQSTYRNGRAYCQDVPGTYLFRGTYVP